MGLKPRAGQRNAVPVQRAAGGADFDPVDGAGPAPARKAPPRGLRHRHPGPGGRGRRGRRARRRERRGGRARAGGAAGASAAAKRGTIARLRMAARCADEAAASSGGGAEARRGKRDCPYFPGRGLRGAAAGFFRTGGQGQLRNCPLSRPALLRGNWAVATPRGWCSVAGRGRSQVKVLKTASGLIISIAAPRLWTLERSGAASAAETPAAAC